MLFCYNESEPKPMKLPLTLDPYHGVDRLTRIPVRTNIDPKVYEHLFKQLCPLHGVQAQLLAHVLNKFHAAVLSSPLFDEYKITKPDGTIAFFYDDGVLTKLAQLTERCNFNDLRLADSGTDRDADSGHDAGGVASVGGTHQNTENVGTNLASKVSSEDGIRRLAQSIFRTES